MPLALGTNFVSLTVTATRDRFSRRQMFLTAATTSTLSITSLYYISEYSRSRAMPIGEDVRNRRRRPCTVCPLPVRHECPIDVANLHSTLLFVFPDVQYQGPIGMPMTALGGVLIGVGMAVGGCCPGTVRADAVAT